MSHALGSLHVFLGRLHIGCAEQGFVFTIATPSGPARIVATLSAPDGPVGRITLILRERDAKASFRDGLFEPLEHVEVTDQLLITGEIGRTELEEGRVSRLLPGLNEVHETGAQILMVPVAGPVSVEVSWWYGGPDDPHDEGIVALDLLWDRALDPMDADSPVRNMQAAIADFFAQHGPPSLQRGDEEET
ncbi:MAG: hypothetical protein KTR31_06930 [Myxococcales bacterium]|nr:hypothetical protein [Myxococcales bacterium]